MTVLHQPSGLYVCVNECMCVFKMYLFLKPQVLGIWSKTNHPETQFSHLQNSDNIRASVLVSTNKNIINKL